VRKLETEIILEYEDEKVAETTAKAVSPDNYKAPKGLSIKTTWDKNRVITVIRCRGKFSTFIATIDDLLFCVSTAEKTIKTIKRLLA
jgi:tRNA threonylcarbamoyladenosine modification (KEOPS) complex  Pcc1 subunit